MAAAGMGTKEALHDLQATVTHLEASESGNRSQIKRQDDAIATLQAHLQQANDIVIEHARREESLTRHYDRVLRKHLGTVKRLRDELDHSLRERDAEMERMAAKNEADARIWAKSQANSSDQVAQMRDIVSVQVSEVLKRLSKAKILAATTKNHHDNFSKKQRGEGGVSREDLDTLIVDLEEQTGVANALKVLLKQIKDIQEGHRHKEEREASANADLARLREKASADRSRNVNQ
eukprot:CAMPEP_0173456292 /NCGR_PEP_ID=MMETSP1357-20121228/55752_1 /TAXON_ID=77926 /ORGANISM="Hemiselmis rufescens, Strain PCC563" /LENGTH=234 /DNA_ID=CAMNT_0014423493 /DNA_START=27 /DNA_END=728 /DNA_ORIENTATION=+